MEHLDTGTRDDWHANQAKPAPSLLHRLAVVAPDDSPGLSALRRRLAQRGPQSLNCDHFAAGFNGTAGVGLASAFEQIQQRHQADPYDIVLLLDGRPEALGIAESNGLIPEQISRMPVPVWTAIGEDDANTELGDVANRVFPNPAALIDALPLPGGQPWAGTVRPAPEAAYQPAAPAFSMVMTPDDMTPAYLPALPSRQAPATPERARPHPLVLCAAGAVIVASITAMAAMLGWLPSRVQANTGYSGQPATTVTVTSLPASPPAAAIVGGSPAAPAPASNVLNAIDTAPAVTVPEPGPELATPSQSTPQSSGIGVGEGTALVAGAAGLMTAARKMKTTAPAPVKRARRAPRRTSEAPFEQAQAPRQVGSTEVPITEFVGTKSRQQVVAELAEARRAANRQAANGNYFPGLGGPSARR